MSSLIRSQLQTDVRPPPPAGERAVLIVLAGLVASLLCGAFSRGYYHADDLTHFLFAQWAWSWPEYLLHDWGRPGFTSLYFLPAAYGWGMARAWSAILSAITAWFTFRIAQRLRIPRPWLAPLFLYLQPLFFRLSETTLTETALTFYLTLAIWLALRDRWELASALLSLGLTARHEAIVFIPIFAAAALVHRQPLRRLWPLLWAPLVVNVLAWLFGMSPPAALLMHPGGTGLYGRGGFYEFFARSLEAFGPAVAVLGFAGIGATLTRDGGGLVVGSATLFFIAQVAVRWLGLYDSAGYSRFLVPIGPLWAIMAASSWNRLGTRDPQRRIGAAVTVAVAMGGLWLAMELMIRFALRDIEVPRLWEAKWGVRIATIGTTLIVAYCWAIHRAARHGGGPSMEPLKWLLGFMILFAALAMGGPLRPRQDERQIDQILAWLEQSGLRERPIVSAHVWVTHRTGVRLPPRDLRIAGRVAHAATGTLVFWDYQFAPAESPPLRLEDLQSPHYRLIYATPSEGEEVPRFQIFEKLVAPEGESPPAPG